MSVVSLVEPGKRREGQTSESRAETDSRAKPSLDGLSLLAERVRPNTLANDELVPLLPALAELVGTPGLRRGTTLLVEAGSDPPASGAGSLSVSGASSLALSLLAEASSAGHWCAVVGLPDLGLLAASELGVELERLVVVPEPANRTAAVTGALLEGFDVVLVRLPLGLSAATGRRLSAKARERRSVLVLAGAGVGDAEPVAKVQSAWRVWPETPEARLSVVAAGWDQLAPGDEDAEGHRGVLSVRRIEVLARRRRASPEELVRSLLLPAARQLGAETPVRLLPAAPVRPTRPAVEDRKALVR